MPAGVLIGFESEDDWFDYRLENDPRFLRPIEQAPNSLRAGGGIRLERPRPSMIGITDYWADASRTAAVKDSRFSHFTKA
jgi:hypothetical protein